ncbi:unnamed protein product [Ostreobium quekettii]|uniref:K Homology domain-containing protein n=1 Tax=Ostreobium quekettii TaxID=121088 RepID=A0A8S1J7K6_9CHLO|nr:unnamed protein product [Ostreobium quekettii]
MPLTGQREGVGSRGERGPMGARAARWAAWPAPSDGTAASNIPEASLAAWTEDCAAGGRSRMEAPGLALAMLRLSESQQCNGSQALGSAHQTMDSCCGTPMYGATDESTSWTDWALESACRAPQYRNELPIRGQEMPPALNWDRAGYAGNVPALDHFWVTQSTPTAAAMLGDLQLRHSRATSDPLAAQRAKIHALSRSLRSAIRDDLAVVHGGGYGAELEQGLPAFDAGEGAQTVGTSGKSCGPLPGCERDLLQVQGMTGTHVLGNGDVQLHMTQVVAGFIIGPHGVSIHGVANQTGARISSWTHILANERVFVIKGSPNEKAQAVRIILMAVQRYKDLTEGSQLGKMMQCFDLRTI